MSVDAFATQLLDQLTPQILARRAPFVLGISGLQGSGKSTLAAQFVQKAKHFSAVTLSLDDFYYTRAERQALAQQLHPLLATRGVPGTHDLTLLSATLDALASASTENPAPLPRFDKGFDDRKAPDHWQQATTTPRLIILEGWCLGLPPQSPTALREPINWLEQTEDPDGRWRGYVNAQLKGPYALLWKRLDHLVLLQAPSFDIVQRWRGEQECTLRQRGAPYAMDTTALRRFIAHYERLSRHGLISLPALADTCVMLDAARQVKEIIWSGR